MYLLAFKVLIINTYKKIFIYNFLNFLWLGEKDGHGREGAGQSRFHRFYFLFFNFYYYYFFR